MILGIVARLVEIPAYFSYCYCYPALFFPLYIYLLLSVTVRLRRCVRKTDVLSLLDIITLSCFVSIVFVPAGIVNGVGWIKKLWVTSESHCIAACAFMLFFDVVLFLQERGGVKDKKYEHFFSVVVIPLFIISLSLTKISFGAALTGAVVYYLLRNHGFSAKYVLLEGLYLICLLGVHYVPESFYSPFVSATTGDNYGISPLYFLHESVIAPEYWGVHVFLYYGFSMLFIIYRLRKVTSIKDILTRIKKKDYIIDEYLLLICIVGAIPGLLFSIGGGSSFYISSIQQIIGVVLLVGYGIPNEIYEKTILPRNPFYSVIFAVLTSCLGCPFIMHTLSNLKILYADCFINDEQYTESIREGSYWDRIKNINIITEGNKVDYYIYVGESADIWNRFSDHDSAMFFYPAMTGVVCIGEYYFENGNVYTNDGSIKDYGWPIKPNIDEPKMTYEAAMKKTRIDGKIGLIYIFEDSFSVEYVQ